MEVRDFVNKTLRQVLEATQSASDDQNEFYLDVGTSKGIHFDLAVSVENGSSSTKSGGAGANIRVLKAGASGSKAKSSSTQNVSRIQFNIKHTQKHPSRSAVITSYDGIGNHIM